MDWCATLGNIPFRVAHYTLLDVRKGIINPLFLNDYSRVSKKFNRALCFLLVNYSRYDANLVVRKLFHRRVYLLLICVLFIKETDRLITSLMNPKDVLSVMISSLFVTSLTLIKPIGMRRFNSSASFIRLLNGDL